VNVAPAASLREALVREFATPDARLLAHAALEVFSTVYGLLWIISFTAPGSALEIWMAVICATTLALTYVVPEVTVPELLLATASPFTVVPPMMAVIHLGLLAAGVALACVHAPHVSAATSLLAVASTVGFVAMASRNTRLVVNMLRVRHGTARTSRV
jgi:hypothetical protein